jgi:hypothetical protein
MTGVDRLLRLTYLESGAESLSAKTTAQQPLKSKLAIKAAFTRL